MPSMKAGSSSSVDTSDVDRASASRSGITAAPYRIDHPWSSTNNARMTNASLSTSFLATTAQRLKAANAPITQRFVGESDQRQPVHTVYGGAQLYKRDSAHKLGKAALKSLDDYAPDAKTLAR